MAETKTVSLPPWAKMLPQLEGTPPTIQVYAELMYETFLSAYGVEEIDQYWLEVCFQSMKLELQLAMGTFGFSIHVEDPTKKYAQTKWPPGRGAFAATKGLEARKHYASLRGRSLPAAQK